MNDQDLNAEMQNRLANEDMLRSQIAYLQSQLDDHHQELYKCKWAGLPYIFWKMKKKVFGNG